jgi:hypothetical protein
VRSAPLAQCPEAFDFGFVGGNQPDRVASDDGPPGGQQATPKPSVQGLLGHSKSAGEFLQGQFGGPLTLDHLTGRVAGLGRDTEAMEEITDHGASKYFASLRRPPPFSIQNVGDRRRLQFIAMKRLDARHQLVVGAQLLEFLDGPDEPVVRSLAAGPMAFDADLLGLALDRDDDAVQDGPGDGLPVVGGGCRSLPERWDVGGESSNGRAFLVAQRHRLGCQKAFMLGLQGQFSRECLFPLPLQATGN